MWSIISNIEAKPKKIKPKGIIELFLIFLNLLIDFIPRNIGINTAWKWAKNRIGKNKIIFKPQPKLIQIRNILLKLSQEWNIPLQNNDD